MSRVSTSYYTVDCSYSVDIVPHSPPPIFISCCILTIPHFVSSQPSHKIYDFFIIMCFIDHFVVHFRSSFQVFYFMGILLSINIVVKYLNWSKILSDFLSNSPPICQVIWYTKQNAKSNGWPKVSGCKCCYLNYKKFVFNSNKSENTWIYHAYMYILGKEDHECFCFYRYKLCNYITVEAYKCNVQFEIKYSYC